MHLIDKGEGRRPRFPSESATVQWDAIRLKEPDKVDTILPTVLRESGGSR